MVEQTSSPPSVAAVLQQLAGAGMLPGEWTGPRARGLRRARWVLRTHREPSLPGSLWLITNIGTWVGAALIAVFLVRTGLLEQGLLRVALGVALLGGAAWVSRRRMRGELLGQLVVVGALGGEALLIFHAARYVPTTSALVMTLVAQGAVVVLVRHASVRVLSTFTAVACLAALMVHADLPGTHDVLVLGVGLAVVVTWQLEPGWGAWGRRGDLQAPVAWGLVVAWMVLLLSQVELGGWRVPVWRDRWLVSPWLTSLGLAVLCMLVVGAAWAEAGSARSSTALTWAAAGLAVVGLAGMGAPGVLASLVVVLLGHHRGAREMVGLGVVFLALFLGAFLAGLDWPLSAQGLLLVGSGVALLVVRGAGRLGEGGARPRMAAWRRGLPVLAGVGGMLVVVAGMAVQREGWVRHGEMALLRLVPWDPHVRPPQDVLPLRYVLADEVAAALSERPGAPADGHVVVRIDGQHVASWVRLDDGTRPLAAGERLLRYRRRGGVLARTVRVGPEQRALAPGQGARDAAAHYAEVRLSPSGEVVLVGLRDAGFRVLGAVP